MSAKTTMSRLLIAALAVSCVQLAAAAEREAVQLVHPFRPAGPAEVVGTAAADKLLRTMQRYAVPAFTDILVMHVAQVLQGESDEPVIVTRKPRRDGREAVMAVSIAAPNARTLLLASEPDRTAVAADAPAATNAMALRRVGVVASMPYVLIAMRDSRYAKADDLVGAARVRSARILIGTPGENNIGHAAIERLRSIDRLGLEPVAYNGGVNALHGLVTDQVSAALVPLPAVLPYLAAGRLKALALAEERRHPAIPFVSTNAEAGLPRLHAATLFTVFAGPAAPPAAVHELEARLARGAGSAEVRQTFQDLGLRLEPAADAFSNQRGTIGTTSRDALRPPS